MKILGAYFLSLSLPEDPSPPLGCFLHYVFCACVVHMFGSQLTQSFSELVLKLEKYVVSAINQEDCALLT